MHFHIFAIRNECCPIRVPIKAVIEGNTGCTSTKTALLTTLLAVQKHLRSAYRLAVFHR